MSCCGNAVWSTAAAAAAAEAVNVQLQRRTTQLDLVALPGLLAVLKLVVCITCTASWTAVWNSFNYTQPTQPTA